MSHRSFFIVRRAFEIGLAVARLFTAKRLYSRAQGRSAERTLGEPPRKPYAEGVPQERAERLGERAGTYVIFSNRHLGWRLAATRLRLPQALEYNAFGVRNRQWMATQRTRISTGEVFVCHWPGATS